MSVGFTDFKVVRCADNQHDQLRGFIMARSLKRTFKIAAIFFFAASFAGCASKPTIIGDYDHGNDFGAYKTWDFIKDAGPDYEGYESLFSQYMREAIAIEMDKRGYVRSSSNPDIFLNFNAYVQDKTKVTQSPSMGYGGAGMGGGYYGYRDDFYDPWGGYGYGTETRVSQYTEGTFNIDIVDAKKTQLVWEAVVVGKITDKDRENLRQVVMEGVPNFFALYPFVAGSSEPVEQEK